MPSHTFNTQAGALATGGTGGGSAQVTGSVSVDKVRDESEGVGLENDQLAFSSSSASADTDVQVIWKRPTTTQLQLRVQDDSSATGPGAGVDYDTAKAYNPTSGTDLYNDLNGSQTGPHGSGTYQNPGNDRWTVIETTDPESGQTDYRLEIWWQGTRIYLQMLLGDQVSSKTVSGITYTKGSSYASTPSGTVDHYQMTRGTDSFSAYAFNSNVGTITAIKMKVDVTTATHTNGAVAPLRTLAGTQLTSGSNDSGWITSNLDTGITMDIQHKPATATSPSGNAVYAFVADVELWARAANVSDTKLLHFNVNFDTEVEI
mgnify:CR=1 FL=1